MFGELRPVEVVAEACSFFPEPLAAESEFLSLCTLLRRTARTYIFTVSTSVLTTLCPFLLTGASRS